VRVVGPQVRRVRLASICPDQADACRAWIARDRVTATARWPSSASKGLRASPSTTSRDYNTSKAAVLGFTRTLAAEWGRCDITVNAICPGFFVTKLATAAIVMAGGEQATAANAPLRRLGDDEDLKGITLLHARDAGRHITGQWLAVDGGLSVVSAG
jgi:NAD(P)-dependent dehydrogenase (short-subunit alcohol dehydrogenase family)